MIGYRAWRKGNFKSISQKGREADILNLSIWVLVKECEKGDGRLEDEVSIFKEEDALETVNVGKFEQRVASLKMSEFVEASSNNSNNKQTPTNDYLHQQQQFRQLSPPATSITSIQHNPLHFN